MKKLKATSRRNNVKKLIIIDDDPIVIQSLQMISENAGYLVVGTGKSAKDAVTLYEAKRPDVVLMDIRMAGESGIEATRDILHTYPHAKILLVTTFEDDAFIKDALTYGAKGYILKQNIHALLPAVEAVLSGHTVLDETIIENVKNAVGSVKLNRTDIILTEREEEIYQKIAEGMNNKEIAEALFLSEGTVRNYVSILLEKFNLRDRTQLAISFYTDLN